VNWRRGGKKGDILEAVGMKLWELGSLEIPQFVLLLLSSDLLLL
jgi:hypothetical protein